MKQTHCKTILIVEDDLLFQRFLQNLLREKYEISIAESAEMALNKLTTSAPDLILLDITLPGIDGIEMLRKIKVSWPDIPVIMLTAIDRTSRVVEAIKLGAFHYLTKPLQVDELLVTLERALESSEIQRNLEQHLHLKLTTDKGIIHPLAYYDDITGLPNRILFSNRLALALADAHVSGEMLAVILLNLDRFKRINDTLGYLVGDQLLRSIVDRLRDVVRKSDTIARIGGDEFALFLQHVRYEEDAARIARKILEAFKPAFQLNDYEFYITPNIGIALYPKDGENAETLLRNASLALYRIKGQGRDNYQFYTSTLNTKAFERLVLENSLRRALERGEFAVYYQPQINLATRQVIGMEALIRWQHPDLGLIAPTKFIPLAEEIGLIGPLSEWVLWTACAQNKAWQDAGFPPLRIAVNLSARLFGQQDLMGIVKRVLEETGLNPNYLDLELTESIVMENAEGTIQTLYELKEMGVHISVDDFGTGYSSLSYLKRFPIDILKIDKSFVQDITTDPNNAAIAELIISMAHTLNLNVIAEGVETEEQLTFLQSHRCNEAQGYLFSKPLSAKELEVLLQEQKDLLKTKSALLKDC